MKKNLLLFIFFAFASNLLIAQIDDAVLLNNNIYFFKGKTYAKVPLSTMTMPSDYPKSLSNWKGVTFQDWIQAAVNWGNGKIYLCNDNQYIRFDIASDKAEQGYPKSINQKSWPGIPFTSFDAICTNGKGKAYIFSGTQYVRYDMAQDRTDPNYPKSIENKNWNGLPWNTIDAAVTVGDKIYFFNGSKVALFNLTTDKVEMVNDIKNVFKNLPADWF